MTPTETMLKEIYIDLQETHNSLSLLKSIYMAIPIYKKIKKS